jgi:hypothetical protein
MRIRILRQTSISGRPARVGDVIDATDSDARILLGMKKAELVPDPDPLPVEITPAEPVLSPRKPRARIKG